jgi:hypothetical protein
MTLHFAPATRARVPLVMKLVVENNLDKLEVRRVFQACYRCLRLGTALDSTLAMFRALHA